MNSDNNWINQDGKKVILIEPDEPWYIGLDKKEKEKPKGIMKKKYVKLNEVSYRNNADYKTNFVMDTTRPDMGYGYSYASRLGQPCLCKRDDKINCTKKLTEHFGKQHKNTNTLMYRLAVIFFIISLIHLTLNK